MLWINWFKLFWDLFISSLKGILMFLAISGLAWGIIVGVLVLVAIFLVLPSIRKWSGRQIEGRDSYDKDNPPKV